MDFNMDFLDDMINELDKNGDGDIDYKVGQRLVRDWSYWTKEASLFFHANLY